MSSPLTFAKNDICIRKDLYFLITAKVMLKSVRAIFLFLVVAALIPTVVSHHAQAQCVGLPTVSSLGSNKFPAGFCSPVSARVTYNVGFLTPVPAGAVDIYIDWGDGKTRYCHRHKDKLLIVLTLHILFP